LPFFAENILDEARKIFADVLEDFVNIKTIIARFQQWKYGFPDTYKQAFVHLCLPKLILPFVKIELLNWNPLVVVIHLLIFDLSSKQCPFVLFINCRVLKHRFTICF
jgi:hypothetical protein